MEKLSKMQKRVYEYIVQSIQDNGYAPSVREIGEALGLKSPSTVHFHVKHLEELGLIENLQREDLNPAEEARGYQTLMAEYGLTQEQVAQRMGKSRPAVTNALRLLNLPEDLMALVEDGSLSAGHARALLGAPNQTLQRQAAKAVLEKGLSVRQTEALVKALQKEKKEKPQEDNVLAIYLADIEKNLGSQLGRKVHIQHKGKKGKVELEYYSEDDLDALLRLLQYSQDGGDFS